MTVTFSVTLSPAGIYIRKVNNRNSKTKCEICSKRRSAVFIVNFKHISHFALMLQLLTLNM